MTFRSIYWDDNDARLKNFSGAAKSDAVSVVKIELEVRDPFRFAALLQDLAEIRRDQAQPVVKPPAAAPKSAGSRRAITSQKPLLLTYQKD